MKLLIDTNVLLDIVLKRNNYETAMNVFFKAKENNAKAYITASSATDLFYIIHKESHDTAATYHTMKYILQLVSILSVTDTDIMEALHREWKDFEDCVQYVTAVKNHIDYVITNNTKDFEDHSIPAISPQEYMNKT